MDTTSALARCDLGQNRGILDLHQNGRSDFVRLGFAAGDAGEGFHDVNSGEQRRIDWDGCLIE